jgi:hypothetical protein
MRATWPAHLIILVFITLIICCEGFKLWSTEFNLFFISSRGKFWIVTVTPKYLNFTTFSKVLLGIYYIVPNGRMLVTK